MPRKSDNLTFAINFAKYQSKKAKSDVEKRRMFDRFCVLAKLLEIQLQDDAPQGRSSDAPVAKVPTLDEQAEEMLKKLKNGGSRGNKSDASSANQLPAN